MKPLKFILILMVATLSVAAQGNKQRGEGQQPNQEKIDAMKIGFITERLDLSTEEAQKFWPVYNKFQDEMRTLREGRRKEMEAKSFETMTDKEVEASLDKELQRRQQEVDILKKYTAELRKVIPTRKVALLLQSEEDFKRELLKRLREGREGQPPMKKDPDIR